MREQPSGSLASFQISVSHRQLNKGKTVLDDVVFRSFSSCYGHDSRQEDIFEADVKPLIDVVYSGAVGPLQHTSFPFLKVKCLMELDGHYLCVWCHVVRQDTYHARKSRATGCHPSSC
jgi:hypothetical protein